MMEGMVELLQVLGWRSGRHQFFSLLHTLLHLEPEPSSAARSGGSSRQIVPCPGEPAASSAFSVALGRGGWRAHVCQSGTILLCGAEAGGGERGEALLGHTEPILPELPVVSA